MILLILIFISRAFKAVSDITKSSFKDSIFSDIGNDALRRWCNPHLSWLNKWKWVDGERIPLTKAPAYYLWLYNPKYKEVFPYSSTWLVKFTDLWHTSEFLRWSCYGLAFIFAYLHGTDLQVGWTGIFDVVGWLTGQLNITLSKNLTTVLSLILLAEVSRQLGFTLFYDYILRRKR